MARSRNIKPGFFANEVLAEVLPIGRLLFAGLWTIADREGRLEDRPKRIKAALLPYDDCNVDELLTQLANLGFIHRYTVGDNQFIQVQAFSRHQNPHCKEPASTIPKPDLHQTCTVQEQNKPGSCPADSLNPITDSLNPVSLIPDTGFLSKDMSPPSASTEKSDSQNPPTGKSKSGTRLAEDWVLPKAWGEWALSEKPELTADAVRTMADNFRDFWVSTAGAKARKVDWLATWRVWVRNQKPLRASHATTKTEQIEAYNQKVAAAFLGDGTKVVNGFDEKDYGTGITAL